MFNELINIIEKQIVYSIYKVGLATAIAPSIMQKSNIKLNASDEKKISRLNNLNQKIGRNDLCLCGSGKKYKKCCGK
jgi:preprotein translocase subunit SecA